MKLNVGDCVLIADRPAAAPELFRAVTRKGRKGWVPRKALRVARKAERDGLFCFFFLNKIIFCGFFF